MAGRAAAGRPDSPPPESGTPRLRSALGRMDWILAGQALLVDGGIAAVKLAPLTRSLGVTTGSFYHHFSGLREYLDALADVYGAENVELIMAELAPVVTPDDRIRRVRTLAEEWKVGRLDQAMRVWATSDERARAAVAQLDDGLLEILRGAFAELGFTQEEARIRALVALAAGVGQPFLFGRPAVGSDAAAALEILIGRREQA